MNLILRNEKKFIIDRSQYDKLEFYLNNNYLKNRFFEYRVNSIYLDDYKKSSFYSSLNGDYFRQKKRYRWYDSNVYKNNFFFIEKKIKKNLVSKKIRKKIELKKVNQNTVLNYIYEKEKYLSPNLMITYNRKNFFDTYGNRVTIDSHLSYNEISKLTNENLNKKFLNLCVLELKIMSSKIQTDLFKKFNLINSSFSKYVYCLHQIRFRSFYKKKFNQINY